MPALNAHSLSVMIAIGYGLSLISMPLLIRLCCNSLLCIRSLQICMRFDRPFSGPCGGPQSFGASRYLCAHPLKCVASQNRQCNSSILLRCISVQGWRVDLFNDIIAGCGIYCQCGSDKSDIPRIVLLANAIEPVCWTIYFC